MAGKHTAGPWEFTGCAISVPGMDVARVYHPTRIDGATFNANGRLIAAAPELLDQHEADMEDLTLLLDAINEGDPKAELVIRVEDMKRRKRAAIARATQPLTPTNEE